MKIAIVHDYLKEFGGAERVLEAMCEIFPDAPIYTAFYQKGSSAWERFKNRDIRVSWAHYVPFFSTRLHSPLRFLAPWIWGSFDFSEYDVVITSASWYVTKGINKSQIANRKSQIEGKNIKPVEVCYCHTPPRWLYGYRTSVEWQRYWPVRVYASIVGHFMRLYDYQAAQRVSYFIANSEEVKRRIWKFYRREAVVIYPPVDMKVKSQKSTPIESGSKVKSMEEYYFVVARIVGAKGLDLAVKAAIRKGFKLKIAGAPAGYSSEYEKLGQLAKDNVEFLGYVSDDELGSLYANAKAFLALAQDEDFGITPVESMMSGIPVIAYKGGGYKETVIDGVTGVFFEKSTVESLIDAIDRFEKMKFDSKDCRKQAEKFSKERFKKEIIAFLDSHGYKTDSHR
ncbi:MAG: glycosyltransferase family 4 protein [Armatimonadetes bacterium]|nr:MAG: glycosyltransferase family 4 protein [Armatimonadota bacterium]